MGIENSINVIFVGWVSYVHEKIASPAKYPNNPVDPFPGYPLLQPRIVRYFLLVDNKTL